MHNNFNKYTLISGILAIIQPRALKFPIQIHEDEVYTIIILPVVLRGCGTWFFTLSKEQMKDVIDNNVQKLLDISCWGDAVFPFMEFVMLTTQTVIKVLIGYSFQEKLWNVLNMPCTLHPWHSVYWLPCLD